VTFNGISSFIYSTCPCFPSSKDKLEKGQLLTESSEIGYFSANGEDIPYKKPYAVIEQKED
jgi:hypothetical protein